MADIKARLVLDGEKQMKEGIKSINTELKAMQAEVKTVTAEMENEGKSVGQLTRQQEALTKAKEVSLNLEKQLDIAIKAAREKYEQAAKATQQYKTQLDQAKRSGTASAEEIAKLEKAVSNSERAERNALNTLHNYEAQLSRAEQTTSGLNKQLQANEAELKAIKDPYAQAGDAADKFSDSNEKAGDAVESLAEAMASSGLNQAIDKIKEALLECIEAANAYGTAIAKVSTLTGDMDVSQISEGLLSMSSEMGVSANELAESMYQALSASVDTASAMDFVRQSTKLAVGGFTDASTAVDTLTTIINAYGLKAADAAEISDKLVTVQNLGKTTVSQLGASLGQVIPIAATYGVDLNNIGAAYVGMTRNGIETANATTYLRAVLNELGKEGSTVSNILKEQTGKDFATLTGQGYTLADTLKVISDSVNGDSTAFANLWGNVRAGLGAMSLVNSGTDEFNRTISTLNTSVGVADDNFNKIADTSERTGKRLENSLENLKIAIGQELQEPLDMVKEKITGVVEGITEWVKNNPGLVKVIGALITGLTMLGATLTAYTTFTKLAEAATKAFSSALGGTTVGKIIVAITAIISAITALTIMFGNLKDDSDILADSAAKLADEQAKSAEEYAASAEEFRTSMKVAQNQTEKATKAEEAFNAALERKRQILVENQKAEDNAAEATAKATDAEEAWNRQIEEARRAGADVSAMIADRNRQLANYNQAVEDSTEVLEANRKEMQRAEADANLYYLQMIDLDEATRAVVDSALKEAESLGTTSDEYAEVLSQLYAMTEAHTEYANTIQTDIDNINGEIAALTASYNDAQEAAYNSLTSQFGLFEEVSVSVTQSVGDMINALKTQADYMETYSANLAKAIELGLSDSLVQALSDGSAESAAILQSIVDDGGANIEALNTQFEKVEQGKQAFSEQLAETQTDFNNKMSALESRLQTAVGKMNQSNQAYQNAVNTVQGYINGTAAMREKLVLQYINLANAANDAYKRTLSINSPSKVFEQNAVWTVEGAIEGTKKKAPELAQVYRDLASGAEGSYSSVSPMPNLGGMNFASSNTVQVFLGDKELTNLMYSGIVRKIESTNRNANASAGRI